MTNLVFIDLIINLVDYIRSAAGTQPQFFTARFSYQVATVYVDKIHSSCGDPYLIVAISLTAIVGD